MNGSISDNKELNFGKEIDLFSKHTDSIGNVLLSMIIVLQELEKKSLESLNKFTDENCTKDVIDNKTIIKIPDKHYSRWRKLSLRHEHNSLARQLLPRSLLVTLVSQYDAYLGRLLRVIFLKKPELLKSSDRQISFETLGYFSTIEDARDYILEKEIESILRSSHSEQFKWMEKAFDLPLTKGLKSWGVFIELTERRNLFVHTDGIVSSQYLSNCKHHNCTIGDSVKEGSSLGVPQKYFETAYACIHEIGIKLGHVLWRKLFPDEREEADLKLIETTFNILESGQYDLACNLLDFSCVEIKKFSNEASQLVLIVNRALAYKFKNEESKCLEIMRAVDWSAKSDDFKLASAVLEKKWDAASKIMHQIGKDGHVKKHDYINWPLFREWRNESLFQNAFQELFGEPFIDNAKKRITNTEAVNLEDTKEE
ncbi:MAG: hypothetical protein Q8K61_09935 [Gallionella sp.]|nr:hypothetical protein [Gallionella sp.]